MRAVGFVRAGPHPMPRRPLTCTCTCALSITHLLVRFLLAACRVCLVAPDGTPFGGNCGGHDGEHGYGQQQQQQQQPTPTRQEVGPAPIAPHLTLHGGVLPEGCSGAARCEAARHPVACGPNGIDTLANGTGADGAAAGQPAADSCPGGTPGTQGARAVVQDTAACDGCGQADGGGGGARGPAGGARIDDGGRDDGAALVGTVVPARAGVPAESGDRGCDGCPSLQPLLARAGAEDDALSPQVRGDRAIRSHALLPRGVGHLDMEPPARSTRRVWRHEGEELRRSWVRTMRHYLVHSQKLLRTVSCIELSSQHAYPYASQVELNNLTT